MEGGQEEEEKGMVDEWKMAAAERARQIQTWTGREKKPIMEAREETRGGGGGATKSRKETDGKKNTGHVKKHRKETILNKTHYLMESFLHPWREESERVRGKEADHGAGVFYT